MRWFGWDAEISDLGLGIADWGWGAWAGVRGRWGGGILASYEPNIDRSWGAWGA